MSDKTEEKIWTPEEYEAEVVRQVAKIISDCEAESSRQWDATYKRGKNLLANCPNCGSKKVVDAIKRLQGEVRGYSSLFSGSVHGEWDTNEVRKCSDCQHEWKYPEYVYQSRGEVLEEHLSGFYYLAKGDADYEGKAKKFIRQFWPEAIRRASKEMHAWYSSDKDAAEKASDATFARYGISSPKREPAPFSVDLSKLDARLLFTVGIIILALIASR